MSDIGVGDWVECINNAPMDFYAPFGPGEMIYVGSIYQIERIWDDEGIPVVALVGLERRSGSEDWGQEVGYGLFRFRPIYRPKQSIIESLKQPVKLSEDA